MLAIFAVLLCVSGIVTPPMTTLAAAPAETPSQISMSIGGGAGEGKTAMSFNWVTDLLVWMYQKLFRVHHLTWKTL